MIPRLLALLAALALSIPMGGSHAASHADKKKIVLIWTPRDHPWQSHMYQHECRLLAACLNQNPDVQAVVSPDPEWPNDPQVLAGASAIVYYSRQAGDIVLGPQHRDEFDKLMKGGAGFTAIHWATKAEDTKLLEEYLAVLGGASHGLPGWGLKTDTRPLIQADPDHPICRGWKSFDLHEEWYFGTKFHEKAVPVLKIDMDGKDQVVAWAFTRADGGRSFGTTLGHFHDNFAMEPFRKAIVNGILWSARIDVPSAGASVALTDELIKLPTEDDGRK